MRILVTNDDGINAAGLAVLEEIARSLAGTDGAVWTVAPAIEQSGTGHCVSYITPFLVTEIGKRRFSVQGTPADCVLVALNHVMDAKPDLVLSGINRGNNAGENTLYSGTIGAAMEGALQGIRSMAVSQYFGPANRGLENPFESVNRHGLQCLQDLIQKTPWDGADYRLFLNVNFPPCPADAVMGMRACPQGFRQGLVFGIKPFTTPSGREYVIVVGGDQQLPSAPGTDVQLNQENWITVTPMRADLTDHHATRQLAEALDGA